MMGGMADEDTMSQAGSGESMAPHDEGDDDSISVFLPKAITMGKTFKAGDEIVLKIKDVDPETGDLEAVYATDDDHKDTGSGMSSSDAFDKAMPEEKEGY